MYLKKRYMDRPLYMGKEYKSICISCKPLSKNELTEEDFSNQVAKLTHSVDSGQPLSSVTPVITKWSHKRILTEPGMELYMDSATLTSTHQNSHCSKRDQH